MVSRTAIFYSLRNVHGTKLEFHFDLLSSAVGIGVGGLPGGGKFTPMFPNILPIVYCVTTYI